MVATADAVQELPILLLDRHPKNTHGELSSKHPKIQELMTSIASIGQTEACIVRPKEGNRFEILSGHIRTYVQELLGHTKVPCVVKDVDDATALAILIASNEKEPVDPLLEADAIDALMGELGGDLQAVAKKLGKGVRYVAGRRNLCTLTKGIRKLYRDGKLADWSIAMLEQLARLSPEAQDELAAPTKGYGYKPELSSISDLDHLNQIIGDRFHALANATWKLDDATLCPKAGSCVACPKTSLRAPGLFDDGDLDPQDPAALKKGVCRDAACWKEKASAVAKQAIAAAKKEADGELLVVKEGHDAPVPKGVKTLDSWQVRDVNKGAKGAKPAVFIREDGSIREGFVVPPRERSAPASPARASKPPKEKKAPKPTDKNFAEKLAASRTEIADRRRAFVESELPSFLEKAEAPNMRVVQGLIVVYGVSWPSRSVNAYGPKRLESSKKLYATGEALSQREFCTEIWPRVVQSLLEDCPSDDELLWFAQIAGVDVKVLEAKAVKEIPDSKWWPKVPALVEEGICRGCNCTHDRACPGGCSWVEKPKSTHTLLDDRTDRHLPAGLCSTCAGAQPKGKKASKKKVKA